MAHQLHKYYRPYISDSEESEVSETDTDTDDESVSQSSSRQPNYRQFASDLQLIKAAGPNFPTDKQQITLDRSEIMAYYETDASGVDIPKITSSKTLVTSIIMLDSRDRDTTIYPQPTTLTLRLPRTYKNITNFQIIQINLLSSFFYFRADKNNLSISIQEQDRYVQDVYGVIKTAANSPLNVITVSIREGTYTIDTLISELNLQLNQTPIFYDFINGFTDFAPIFTTSGDYSIIFNQPGDNFYDALNNIFIIRPTMLNIIQKYFNSQYAGLSSYSTRQLKVAYYYPVLKEMLLDAKYGIDNVNLNITDITNLNYPVRTDAYVFERCVYKFEGLDDTIIQQVIDLNITVLDTYRIQHTFRNYLINKYNVTYSTNNNRITISSTSLNTSLSNLLTNQYNQIFLQQLAPYGITVADFSSLNTTSTLYLAIITDMFNFIQVNLANYFGINYNTFSLLYFTNILNQLPLQEGLESAGVKNSFTINNVDPFTTNLLSKFTKPNKPYWPEMRKLPNTYTSFPASSIPYDLITDKFDTAHTFTDANGVIYQNPILKSTNMIVNIDAAKYTVFTFRSFARQTLRVTALPRPTKYRYTAYNTFAQHPAIFDNSYAFIDIIPQMDVSGITLNTIPGFSKSDTRFGSTSAQNLGLWGSRTISLFYANNAAYFTFIAPPVSSTPGIYKYNMSIAIQATNSTPLKVFIYHDRGAFMADISDARNEKAIHYIKTANYTGPSTTAPLLSFNVYAQEQYYILVRSVDASPDTTPFIISPYFTSGTNYTIITNIPPDGTFDPLADPTTRTTDFNYLSVADPDFLRLPSASSLWSKTPGVDSNYYVIPGNSYVNIGYDLNGVSSDLTDYVGFTSLNNCDPSSSIRIDPISGYIFKVGAGYNTQTKTYLNIGSAFGSGNQILTSNSVSPLSTLAPLTYETVIAHWYSQIFIPNTANQIYVNGSNYAQVRVGNTLYSYPYVQDIVYPNIFSKSAIIAESQLAGYTFADNKLSLGNGVIGISLIPDDGIWDIKKIMLRSAYITAVADTNRNIKYLGIFPASVVSGDIDRHLNVSNALMTFELATVNTYAQGEGANSGFDTVGGTYYEWTKTTGIQYLYGYAQTPGKMIPDINAYYSIVPFTEDGKVTTYSLLSGSLVPYPFYSDANATATYLDGSSTPSGTFVITPQIKINNPTLGPPLGYDQSQSKYEQSVPIGATLLQYLQAPILSSDPLACKVYTTNNISLTGLVGEAPFTNICFRVANHCLISRGGQYDIYSYISNTEDARIFTFITSITLDLFFMNNPETEIVGVSGNNSTFAMLGLNTLPYTGASNLVFAYSFFIETYNPVTQVIELVDTIVINGPVYTPSGLPGTTTNPLLPQISGTDIPITSIVGDGIYIAYVMDPTSLVLNTAIFIRNAELIGFNGAYLINKLITTSVTPTITLTYATTSTVTYSTSLTTGLVVGGAITVSDTSSYNGLFIISSIVTNTSFTVKSYTYFVTNARGDIQPIRAISIPGDGTITYSIVNTVGCSAGEVVTVTGALPMLNGTFVVTSSVVNSSFTVPIGSYTATANGNDAPLVTSITVGDGGIVTYFVDDVSSFNVGDTITFTTDYDTSTAILFSKNPTTSTFTVKNVTAQAATATTQLSCVVLATTVGVLNETAAIGASGYEIINVTSFNYNDNHGFTFMIEYGLWNTSTNTYQNRQSIGITKGTPTQDISQPFILVTNPSGYPGFPATYQLLQSPYEPLGRFYVAAKTSFITRPTILKYPIRDPMLVNNYLYTQYPVQYNQNGLFYVNSDSILDTNDTNTGAIVINSLSNIGAPAISVLNKSNLTPRIVRFNLIQDTNTSAAAAFGDITLLQNPYDNKIILSYDMYDMISVPTKTYSEVVRYGVTGNGSTSNAIYTASAQVIKNYDTITMCPSQVLGGGGGSFWILFNEKGSTSTYDAVWGNRGDTIDFPVTVSNAYQIFYPTQRIVMTKIARSYNPITDISGIVYPEYPHTAMFAYNSLSSFNADISTKWGLESNYISADTSVSSGFYFNACDLNIPLNPSSTPYYLALRGYSPSEKSQVMLRFSLPNRYDFGYVTINDLSNEILLSQTNPLLFNSNYTNTIQQFNRNFIFDSNGRVFGSNVIAGYGGSNITNINGFGEYMNKFLSLYSIYNSKNSIINAINTATQTGLQKFITTDLGAIIPVSLRTRQRYTDPLVYSILWKTALPPQYKSVEDAWGLGWNLGYNKFDTPYLTTHVAQSFYKILDEYINLRLNPEFNMNHMDTGSKENLQVTQDTTGSLNTYYGKLLLNSFGSYSQTIISNPIVFQIPIPKIDKLTFAWYDSLGVVINNADCEWTTVIQIVEQVDIVSPS